MAAESEMYQRKQNENVIESGESGCQREMAWRMKKRLGEMA
jgi:hypothetical protein